MSSTQHPMQYIVKLNDHVNMGDHIQLFDRAYNSSNATLHKVAHKWSPEFTNAYVGEFSAKVLELLEKHENVEYISENTRMTAEDHFDMTTQKDAGWGLSRINQEDKFPTTDKASDVNYEYKYDLSYETGSGVDIYVLDSGIYLDHNDSGGRAEWGYTIQGAKSDDLNGQGTHVAGIAASGNKPWEVAKDVKLIAVEIQGDEGSFTVADAVKGIEWTLNKVKSNGRPSIANMNHGIPHRNRFWNENVTKLVKNGIHVVLAAGNKNWDACNTSPASAPLVNTVNTVGATNIADERYTIKHSNGNITGSNYGPCVDSFAPGQLVNAMDDTRLLDSSDHTFPTRYFILPDLVSHCRFPLSYHINGDEIAQQSVDWLNSNCPDLSPKQRHALRGLQAGKLTAYCYPTATPERLRVVSDFLNYLFHLDNISDGMMTRQTDVLADVVMNAVWFSDKYMPTKMPGKEQADEELYPGKLARDFWARCIPGCGPGAQERFKETLEFFFEAVNIEARAREGGVILDLESYIDNRRETSGCKPCWALIEYSLDIDLPDFVVEHPVIQALNQGANDLVTWSNDLFSYNVEQARGDTQNMIIILMQYQNLSLQGAVDYVGELCKQTIDKFSTNKTELPSWGPEIDEMVARYVQGLQDWIVGSLHWSFQTQRYFGNEGSEVKKHRLVKLQSAPS